MSDNTNQTATPPQHAQLTKPGYKTTEFYVTLLTLLGSFVGMQQGKVSGAEFKELALAVGGLFVIARTVIVALGLKIPLPTLPAFAPAQLREIDGEAREIAPIVEEVIEAAKPEGSPGAADGEDAIPTKPTNVTPIR
jgi:hypothetical protein